MRLLEIVQGTNTAADVLASGFALARRLGKIGVLSGVCDGFIGNRLLARERTQTDYMLEDGAMPWDVDRAMEDFGMAMGPFKVHGSRRIGHCLGTTQTPSGDPRSKPTLRPDCGSPVRTRLVWPQEWARLVPVRYR